jgi:hypothetical protein
MELQESSAHPVPSAPQVPSAHQAHLVHQVPSVHQGHLAHQESITQDSEASQASSQLSQARSLEFQVKSDKDSTVPTTLSLNHTVPPVAADPMNTINHRLSLGRSTIDANEPTCSERRVLRANSV